MFLVFSASPSAPASCLQWDSCECGEWLLRLRSWPKLTSRALRLLWRRAGDVAEWFFWPWVLSKRFLRARGPRLLDTPKSRQWRQLQKDQLCSWLRLCLLKTCGFCQPGTVTLLLLTWTEELSCQSSPFLLFRLCHLFLLPRKRYYIQRENLPFFI